MVFSDDVTIMVQFNVGEVSVYIKRDSFVMLTKHKMELICVCPRTLQQALGDHELHDTKLFCKMNRS